MHARFRGTTWRVLAGVLVALAISTVAGCGGDADTPTDAATAPAFPVTVTDDAGRDVTMTAEPERIVSLAPGNTEIVAALGLEDRLVGVTTFDDYPPSVTDLPKVGDFANPNLEAVAAADPDLVLATTGVQAETIAKLEELGAVVIAVDPQTLEGLYDSILMVGAATGANAPAADLVESMRADLRSIQESVSAAPGAGGPVTVFVEIAQDPLFTAGAATLIDDLLNAAGGANVVTQKGYVAYSLEQLVKDDPAVYLATKGSMSDPAALGERPGFDNLSAVKNGRVAVLDDNLVSRPGPRVVEGVRAIAEALHPQVFGKE